MLLYVYRYFKQKSVFFHVFCWTSFGLSVFLLFSFSYVFLDETIINRMCQSPEKVPSNRLGCNDDLKLVCYYNFPTNESSLVPEQIPETLCTHIILAFAGINQTLYSLYISPNNIQIIPRISLLKLKNKNLKIMISVGGAGSNDDFSQMVKNHKNRKMFINSTMQFIKKYNLDGLDIDWEWPSSNGNYKEKVKFVQLLQETREEFDRHYKKYILSIAAGALRTQIEISYYLNYIKQYVDFFNLMTYDYHFYTSYYPVTDYNAPLYASAKDRNTVFSNLNINSSIYYWVSQLIPKNKLILGIPAFGHTYKLMSSLNHDLHSPANGFGTVGESGFIKYHEVCNFLSLWNTFHVRDDDAKVPYAYNQYNWISYDDEYSIGIKTEYIIREKLGGAMVYSLNAEDYSGICRKDKVKFPLITKVQTIFKGCTLKRE